VIVATLINGVGIEKLVRRFVAETLDAGTSTGLHDLVMGAAEKPLMEAALFHCRGNQTRAATMLGINRNTLRSKANRYGIAL
jgi:Fis family transcriptional regulator